MAVNIPINQNDIQYAKTFMTQYLQDTMPEADFSDGTAMQDLVVKALSYSFAYIRSEIAKVKTLRSLAELQVLEEDEEVNEAVDDIISNFFINRGTGDKAYVTITITLSQKVDLFIGTGAFFNRDGTHRFFPDQNYNIAKEALIERTSQSGVRTYETDINVIAENIGEDYRISAGNFVSWAQFNPYILTVRNQFAASGGSSEETNADYIDRSKEAITVRNLINPRSIRTVLLEKFKDYGLKDVTTIGYGDPEMKRDIINTNVTWTTIDILHIGNHQDVYVNLPLVEDQTFTGVTYVEQFLGEPDRPGALQLPSYPVYKIKSVKDASTLVDLPYTLYIRDPNRFYTEDQEAYVVLVSGDVGRTITVTFDSVSSFSLISTYLKDPDERITLSNTLARAVIPIYISFDVKYRQIIGQPDLDTTAAIQTCVTFINSLSNTDTIDVDSILKEIHTYYGTSISVQSPLVIQGTVIYPNGNHQSFYSDNVLTVPEYPSLGVTDRVCGYFTSASYITFTRVN